MLPLVVRVKLFAQRLHFAGELVDPCEQRGRFCVIDSGRLYFFGNASELTGSVADKMSPGAPMSSYLADPLDGWAPPSASGCVGL
jgi:hypothetical protein